MVDYLLDLFHRYFPYIDREDKTVLEILENKENVLVRASEELFGEEHGFAVVNGNAILLFVVEEEYRCRGIGTKLLEKCENVIRKKGYDRAVLGVGFDYLMPGVPTSRRYGESVHENLCPEVNTEASDFFEKRGYVHAWKTCNCFDMKMSLKQPLDYKGAVGDTINGVTYRWGEESELTEILCCVDDACQHQEESFSKYYRNPELYRVDSMERVLVAEKAGQIIGCLIVSAEVEGIDLGSVGCTSVRLSETHQGIATNLVKIGTSYLQSLGLSKASLSYTYSGLDKLYGEAGYEISTYYFMGVKRLDN